MWVRGVLSECGASSCARRPDTTLTPRCTMPRMHAFEIGDQSWCPRPIRDATTDILEFFLRVGNFYAPIVSPLRSALEKVDAREVVDLCSGGGGPWLRMLSEFGSAAPASVVLTDKYPNAPGAHRVAGASHGRLRNEPRSVDATDVPNDLRGFRTMFTSFHHWNRLVPPDVFPGRTRGARRDPRRR